MEAEIIIGVGGLLLAALTYFAGVRRTEKRLDKEDRAARMDAVFNRYMELRRTNYTGGYDGLLKAGVATLGSDKEIREIAKRIVGCGESDPIHGLDGVNLKVLFTYAAKNKINFHLKPIDDIVSDAKA
jgi:hypothetical protein